MKTTIKATDNFDVLIAGHTYEVVKASSKRLVRLQDKLTGNCASLYKFQLEDGVLRNKLVWLDDAHSQVMESLTGAYASVLNRTVDGFIY